MDITEVSILHHIGIVLILLWIFTSFGFFHPVLYFASFIYLYLVNERYSMRLRKKLCFEERKQANQRRLLSDSETVRWLNHAMEKIWPVCMEQIASQKILLPIIPWFLDKYKPWTARKAVVQHMYLGRNPPMFTEIRVIGQSTDDDHLVLELGMSFLSADDMSAILAVQLRKRLGFGMWAKMHVTGMHIEGKVLVGVKFLRQWPFLGRLRVCFVEPPYFQMTVKPIFSHGLDVTELPGIAGWLDKILDGAFGQTLIEPNMLVVDLEKFASSPTEGWFSMDEKRPIAFSKVEIVEAADMKPSDLNGLADPYVKGKLGPYSFRTKIQKKTLAPKWHEEFKIPICTWESPNVLFLEVLDKDHIIDDTLGDCSISISELRGGQRHDKWIPLQNIKMGRLHVAITVHEVDPKEEEHVMDEGQSNKKEKTTPVPNEAVQDHSNHVSSEQAQKEADEFEPINIEGQERTGIWVHHPGSDVAQSWEPRKGRTRHPETQLQREENDSIGSPGSVASGPHYDDSSSDGGNPDGKRVHTIATIRKNLRKISTVFHRSPRSKNENGKDSALPTLRANVRAVGENAEKRIQVKIEVEANNPTAIKDTKASKEGLSPERNDSPSKGHMKEMARGILKQAGKSAHGLKHVLIKKGSSKSMGETESAVTGRENSQGLDSFDDESIPSSKGYCPIVEGARLVSAFPLDSGVEYPNGWEESVQVGPLDSATENRESLDRTGDGVGGHGESLDKKDDMLGHHDIHEKLPIKKNDQGEVEGSSTLKAGEGILK
ncbi:C2 domain-containing protein At1g53590-like [Tasmannia lanceolata]|uniref:C2 domain-containing protein At1g53590-like n=1 Tax=Tasmannia lanceolata TaxID=3420 RepID=UPI004062BC87